MTCPAASAAAAARLPPVRIRLGTAESIQPVLPEDADFVTEKGKDLKCTLDLPETLPAPVAKGDPIGNITVYNGTEPVKTIPVTAPEDVPRLTLTALWRSLLGAL